jgi:hypothetical protein
LLVLSYAPIGIDGPKPFYLKYWPIGIVHQQDPTEITI